MFTPQESELNNRIDEFRFILVRLLYRMTLFVWKHWYFGFTSFYLLYPRWVVQLAAENHWYWKPFKNGASRFVNQMLKAFLFVFSWTPDGFTFLLLVIISFFIGPESDHWQCLSVTDSLTHSLIHCRSVNLIDVTLACEDVNSKLVEVVNVDDEDRVGNSLLHTWELRLGN